MRKHHEDEKKIFDFIQEWPINNDNDPDLDIPENDKDQSVSPLSTRPVLSL
jgi:hypothetical protein